MPALSRTLDAGKCELPFVFIKNRLTILDYSSILKK